MSRDVRYDVLLIIVLLLMMSAVSVCIGWIAHDVSQTRPLPPSGLTATQWRCIEFMPGSADCRVLERVK